MKNSYANIISEIENGHEIVLGILLKTTGSTPQVPGATAIFSTKGVAFGTLGGGMLEAEAERLAIEAIKSKQTVLHEINFKAKIEDQSGAICGGSVLFLLDANPHASYSVFKQINVSLQQNTPGVLLTEIIQTQNHAVSLNRLWITEYDKIPETLAFQYKLSKNTLVEIHDTNKAGILNLSETSSYTKFGSILFAQPIVPSPQLIIAGAGHIGQALCHLGRFLGFEVTILDNRPELAIKERFPEAARLIVKNMREAFEEVLISKNSFIVIVTQGHRTDMEALAACIHSDANYIGMIGSKRKIKLVRDHFICQGLCTTDEFDRIHAPIGLDIRSVSVPEIATSIAAQLIEVKNRETKSSAPPPVWCMVLAAGQSTRMKQQKLLMRWNGQTIIETVVHKALASIAEKVLVITGSHNEEVNKQIRQMPVLTAENKDFARGMLSSVQCGIQAVPGEVGAVIIMLGDQPMVETGVINQLIRTWRATNKGLIVPVWNGKRGHPLLIDLKFRNDINRLSQNIGLRELLLNHPEDILELDVASDSILKDIDTPEDYRKELNQKV